MADDYDDIDEQNPRDRLPKGYFDFSYLYKPPEQKDTLPFLNFLSLLFLLILRSIVLIVIRHLVLAK